MSNDTCRYFIELQPEAGPPVPRYQETELRRAQALRFITAIRQWLQQLDISNKVATLAVTAFGQIQITCESDIISHLPNYDDMSIAVIRRGSDFAGNFGRLALM